MEHIQLGKATEKHNKAQKESEYVEIVRKDLPQKFHSRTFIKHNLKLNYCAK
jgi:predicted NAD-dependent protein-ADP-ribosyltransferase YbiA (DUF1768 family)|tara:strand:- start:338 stop:493 length:156 start_codon:yes stop_codon:yes gene_type:complete